MNNPLIDVAANILIQHQTGGCCSLGEVCEECDCFASSDTPPGHHKDGYAREHAAAILRTVTPMIEARLRAEIQSQLTRAAINHVSLMVGGSSEHRQFMDAFNIADRVVGQGI